MSTLNVKSQLVDYLLDKRPIKLESLADTIAEMSTEDRFGQIMEIFLANDENLDDAFGEVIFFHETIPEEDNAEFYCAFGAIYDDDAHQDYFERLAQLIVKFFKNHPDRQEEITDLMRMQRLQNGFYGDPNFDETYFGSEFHILSEVIDFSDPEKSDQIEIETDEPEYEKSTIFDDPNEVINLDIDPHADKILIDREE
ncbi:MAG: hypothetical protein WCP93_03615 [Candidatus Berkelbacteria bacterium]